MRATLASALCVTALFLAAVFAIAIATGCMSAHRPPSHPIEQPTEPAAPKPQDTNDEDGEIRASLVQIEGFTVAVYDVDYSKPSDCAALILNTMHNVRLVHVDPPRNSEHEMLVDAVQAMLVLADPHGKHSQAKDVHADAERLLQVP